MLVPLSSLVPISSPLLIAGRTTTGAKLHWLQRQFNAFGIPSRNTSQPGAALCLEVPRERLEEARGLLSIVEGMPDDDARLSRRFWPLNMVGNLAPEQWARNEFKQEALASFVYRYFDLLEPERFSVFDMVVHGSPVDHNHAGSEVERGILVSGGECFQIPAAEGATHGTWVRSGLYFLETGGLALSVAHGRYRPEGMFTTLLRLYVVVTPCVDFDMRAVAEGFAQRLSHAGAPAEALEAARALAQVQDAPTPPPPPPGPSVEEKHAALAAVVTRYFHLLPKVAFGPEDFPDDEYTEVQESVSSLMEGVPLCHGHASYFPETPGAAYGQWRLSHAFMCADGTWCFAAEWGYYGPSGITHAEPRQVERLPGSDLPELDLTEAAQVLVEHLTRAQAPSEAVADARALAQLEAAPPAP